MLFAVAGGALQGLEVTYLARKAGHEVLVLDRRADAPARGIGHRFALVDLTDVEALAGALEPVDLVLPATENPLALHALVKGCRARGTPLAFDPRAYAVSSSKAASYALFRRLGLPAPAPWPGCPFPVLAKPDGKSGSEGVEVFSDPRALEARFGKAPPDGWVIQEYLRGPAFSVEVVGNPGAYAPLQVTRLEMDRRHGCKRVVAPSGLPPTLAEEFRATAVALAEALKLTGIMDVEAILHGGKLQLLEIDARFPSQTPAAVYHATGVNMVEALAEVTLNGRLSEETRALISQRSSPEATLPTARGALLEHIRFRDGELAVCGEAVMTGGGPLHLAEDFFGATEALTTYAAGKNEWVATLMITATDAESARERRELVIRAIMDRIGVESCSDEEPPEPREAGA